MSITEDIVKDANKYYVTIVTKLGKIKRMPFDYIKKVRANGLRVITLNEDDDVVSVKLLEENKKIMIVSFAGKSVLFEPARVRPMGRTAMGVKAMNIDKSEIVSVNVVEEEDMILFVSENGYGKKTMVSEFRETNRGTKGIKAMNVDKSGGIVKSLIVTNKEEIMIITPNGIAIRTKLDAIPLLSRNTKGVKLIKLDEKDKVYDVNAIESSDDELEQTVTEDIPTNEKGDDYE
jgi:DNA gyrase subunit A